jgi:hypothetical protein
MRWYQGYFQQSGRAEPIWCEVAGMRLGGRGCDGWRASRGGGGEFTENTELAERGFFRDAPLGYCNRGERFLLQQWPMRRVCRPCL